MNTYSHELNLGYEFGYNWHANEIQDTNQVDSNMAKDVVFGLGVGYGLGHGGG